MSTNLVLPEGTPPPGARSLGVRNAPSLRLSIGFRNPQRNNAPDKLDYFRAKEGANKEYAAAARKFHDPTEGYGPTPRAIDIRLPSRLEDAIRIEYLAFKGNRDDPAGGVMIARGNTNFATLGYCGGPDTLTVWDQDGTVRQVETAGVDAVSRDALDKTAKDLGLMLCTTFCVGLPKILGFGSHAEITSKSLRSTDQIWHKLREWYQAFPNGTITWAMRPILVVKPAHANPTVRLKDGTTKRIRSLVYVLDVVQPESEDQMVERLEQYHGVVRPSALPAASLPELSAVPVEEITDAEVEISEDSGMVADEPAVPETSLDVTTFATTEEDTSGDLTSAGGVEQDALPRLASGSATPANSDETPSLEPDVIDDVEPMLEEEASAPASTPEDRAAAEAAGKVKPPMGAFQTKTLAWIGKNPKGQDWLAYAIGQSVKGAWAKDAKFERALWAFVKVEFPELYDANKEHAK